MLQHLLVDREPVWVCGQINQKHLEHIVLVHAINTLAAPRQTNDIDVIVVGVYLEKVCSNRGVGAGPGASVGGALRF